MKLLAKNKYKIFAFLFLISLIGSLILSLAEIEEICNINEGCSVVQHSIYSKTFGIKNSHYGIPIFSFMLLITLLHIKSPAKNKKQIINAGIIIGSIIAAYFIYVQQFILHAYCKYCMIVDISLLAALAILIITWKNS